MWLVLFVITGACSSLGDALLCWNCTNVGRNAWDQCLAALPIQPANEGQRPFLVDCATDTQLRFLNLTADQYLCRFQVQTIRSQVPRPANASSVTRRINRSCGFANITSGRDVRCDNFNGRVVFDTQCQCFSDGCNNQNGASRLTSTISWRTLATTAAAAAVCFFFLVV